MNANIDAGTGLLDREGSLKTAATLIAATPGRDGAVAALWVDIDRFHQINESFGHEGGDAVIAHIAQRLRTGLSPGAAVARMGSDEFVCLLPGLDRTAAVKLSRRLRRGIEEPLRIDNILYRPSASIGVALSLPDEDPLHLLERADGAKREAKRQGGDRVVVSGEEPLPGRLGVMLAREELVIENDLHSALESGGLRLHYQPIVGCDGRIEAVEALMRCSVGGRTIVPGKFIPVAEKTGLIVRLGEWSLLQGAQCGARLRQKGLGTKVAINVSRAQIASPKFLQALHAALVCADVGPELIELELTESLFMDLSETVQSNLRGAREAGVALAIDDFGTGYSCLANLKDLPATKLKLDRAFVSVLPEDRRALAVVRAMTQLGRELGMTVVAEGVETLAQLEVLELAGVDAIQGYYRARPMDEEALVTWFQKRRTG